MEPPPGLISDDDNTDHPGLVVSSESDITDTSGDEEEIDRSKEAHPSTVPFHFLRTGLSIIKYFIAHWSLLLREKQEGGGSDNP